MKTTRILFLLLVLVLSVSLFACGGEKTPGGNGGNGGQGDNGEVTEPVDPPLNGYVVDTLTVGGIDIAQYVIVQGDNLTATEKLIVPKLQAQIKRLCGVELPIVLSNAAAPAEYEILIGNTGREETSVALEAGHATVKQQGNKIVLYGNGEYSNLYVLKTFIQDILGAVPTTRVYNIEMPVYDNVEYENPNLAGTNMPLILQNYKAEETYDPDFKDNANIISRFYATLNEFPEEVTVLPRYEAESFPLSMQTQIFVATDGNDANEGTIDAPLATVEAALNKVKAAFGAVIWVRGGIYSTNVEIRSVNGTTVSPVIISAYEDEIPVFTTGKSLSPSDFAPVDFSKDTVAQRIPAAAQPNIVAVNLKTLGWTDAEIGSISKEGHPNLYIDGNAGNLARYPNAGEPNLYFDYVFDTGSVTGGNSNSDLYAGWIKRVQSGEFDDKGVTYYTDSYKNKNCDWGWVIRMKDLTPCEWVNTGNIWYFGNVFEGWETAYYNIESFDFASKKMTSKTGSAYGAKHSTNSPTGFNTYYLFNAIEALDSAGEWFYDVDTGILYVYKTEGFENAQLLYAPASKENTITVGSSKNVILNGLSVNVSGNHGINMGGYLTVASHNVLEHCNINLSNAAECIVEYNDVRGGSKTISDGGLIYLFALYNHGNHIRYNYLHDWNAPGCGVYFDDMSMNQYAYYNIIDTTAATSAKKKSVLYTSTGHYNVFFGNIIVGRKTDRINESCIFFWGSSLAYRFPERMKEYNKSFPGYNLGKFYTRFPELEAHFNLVKKYVNDSAKSGYKANENEVYLRSPQNNVMMNNVVLGFNTPVNQDILKQKNPVTGELMTSLDHIDKNYSNADPDSVLVDFRNGDFTIIPEALDEVKAVIPDFWALSTENIGLTYDIGE